MKKKIFLLPGDNFGWALDQDNYSLFISLRDHYDFTRNIRNADILFAPWFESLYHVKDLIYLKEKKEIWCGVDNPIHISLSRQISLNLLEEIDLWIVYSEKAIDECKKYSLKYKKICKFPLTSKNNYKKNKYIEDIKKINNKENILLLSVQRDSDGKYLKNPKIQKNPSYLFEFYKYLYKKNKNIVLILAGPRRHWIIKKLKKENIPFYYIGQESKYDDAFRFLSREDLYELYKICDFNLVNSLWEGGPYSGIEAIWNGCINISTDVGLMKEITSSEFLLSGDPILDSIKIGELFDSVEEKDLFIKNQRTNQLDKLKNYYLSNSACYYLGDVKEKMYLIKNNRYLKSKFYNRIIIPTKNFIFRLKLKSQKFKFKSEYKTISIIREFHEPPFGGGNQFMIYLLQYLRNNGFDVRINYFGKDVEVFIADYCWFNEKYIKKLHIHQNKYSSKLIHRIDGVLSFYREDGEILDSKALAINKLSSHSVIQSMYTLNQFKRQNIRLKNPSIIYNSVDESIFKPSNREFPEKNKIKIISGSWSTNKQKGMDDYLWLDENIGNKYEYNFVGRLDFNPKNLNLIPPQNQKQLSIHFRNSDLFIFCAKNESCSNILLEAMSSGLPIIFKNSGGSSELLNGCGLAYNNVKEIPDLIYKIKENYSYYKNLIMNYKIPSAGEKYKVLINSIINSK